MICLKIIEKAKFLEEENLMQKAIHESDELVAIFVKSVETATTNRIRNTS